jgi:uncharacterized integral membrane protein
MKLLDRGGLGVLSFTIGGAILSAALFFVLVNVNKPYINQTMFMLTFVLPASLAGFLFLGYGLLLIAKSARD